MHRRWQVKEVGDGNLNLVFIVTGEKGAAIVKQALPYVRLVGERWPLPLKRSFFEYHALTRQAARDPGMVPEILFFDAEQAMIIMEYLTPHVILRRALIAGRRLPKIGRDLGLFAARTLFRGSDLSMPTRDKKADLALFADNVELCDITENLVFSDPYFEAEDEPPHHPAARQPGRGTAPRPRPEGRGAAAETYLFRQGRNPLPRRPAYRFGHGHRRRDARHRSGIRLLRPDQLRCRHAARRTSG